MATQTDVPVLRVLRDPEPIAAALDPERRELLEALRGSPDSASGLARRLGDSRQRLNYHLRALEQAGLVELQEERRRGNCTERVLRVAARRYLIDPGVLGGDGEDDPASFGDRFSAAYLLALGIRLVREVGGLRDRAEEEGLRLATVGADGRVRLSGPAAMEEFVEDLSRALTEVIARHDDPGPDSRPFRVVAATYPAPPTGGAASEGGDDEPVRGEGDRAR